MTSKRFLFVAGKRWYITVFGVLLTVLVTFVGLRPEAHYWSHTTVTVMKHGDNPLREPQWPLTHVASTLAIRANQGTRGLKTSSPDVPLYGQGTLIGEQILVRDEGGQWTVMVQSPVLDIEVVGPTSDSVSLRMDRLVRGLQKDLESLQNELSIPRDERLFLHVDPEPPVVVGIFGSRSRVIGGGLALGLTVTGVMLYFSDRRWPIKGGRRGSDGVR